MKLIALLLVLASCSPCENAVTQLGAEYALRVKRECARGDTQCPAYQEYLQKRKALDVQCLPQSQQ